jgi:hypothetical protein
VLGSEKILAEGGWVPGVVAADVVGVVLGIGWVAIQCVGLLCKAAIVKEVYHLHWGDFLTTATWGSLWLGWRNPAKSVNRRNVPTIAARALCWDWGVRSEERAETIAAWGLCLDWGVQSEERAETIAAWGLCLDLGIQSGERADATGRYRQCSKALPHCNCYAPRLCQRM